MNVFHGSVKYNTGKTVSLCRTPNNSAVPHEKSFNGMIGMFFFLFRVQRNLIACLLLKLRATRAIAKPQAVVLTTNARLISLNKMVLDVVIVLKKTPACCSWSCRNCLLFVPLLKVRIRRIFNCFAISYHCKTLLHNKVLPFTSHINVEQRI